MSGYYNKCKNDDNLEKIINTVTLSEKLETKLQ